MPILTCPSPQTITPLLGTANYVFSLVKFPEITFFVQDVELPAVTLGVAYQNSSVSDIPIPGETMEYEPLTCSFIVDEKMDNYLALHRWIMGLGYPTGHALYRELMADAKNSNSFTEIARGYTDGTLTILNNANQPIMQARFADCFPSSLSGLRFDSKNPDSEPITATVTFQYSYYIPTTV